ncbi:hypothetical protein MMC28_011396 [Mycoblastus sanguinarius]|nr:hypothetical protein [Mycoblastus sanguinarius]
MSKRRYTDKGIDYIGTPIKSITQEQLAALHELRAALPTSLDSLAPILENMLAAYDDIVPPHKRPVMTRPATDLKGIMETVMVLGINYRPNTMDYDFKLKEDEQEALEMNLNYGTKE